MQRNIIFHLPYKPDKNKASASQIRPYKMIEAFKGLGYNVAVIMGHASERKIQIAHIKREIQKGKAFDFMYSESSTMPTLLTDPHHLPLHPFLDFGFIRLCKNKGIPVGLFYRDIHWKFEHYELKKYSYKRFISRLFYKLDLTLYKKYIDIIYLPSLETAKHIPELKGVKIEALPPGTDKFVQPTGRSDDNDKIKFLYVGGIGELYDLNMFLGAVATLPQEGIQVTVCTRQSDYSKVSETYNAYFEQNKVKLVHLQGENLRNLYLDSDICCLFVYPTAYWEFVVPFKLFEYIAYKKPILAVKGTAVGNFVEKHQIGWSIPYELEAIEDFLLNLEENFKEQEKSRLLANMEKVIKFSTWTARAEFVAKSLLSVKTQL